MLLGHDRQPRRAGAGDIRPVRLIDDNARPRRRGISPFCTRRSSTASSVRKSALLDGVSTMLIANRFDDRVRQSRVTIGAAQLPEKRVEDRLGTAISCADTAADTFPESGGHRAGCSGRVLNVVSTNALELGIDIGSLSACVTCSYQEHSQHGSNQAGRHRA